MDFNSERSHKASLEVWLNITPEDDRDQYDYVKKTHVPPVFKSKLK